MMSHVLDIHVHESSLGTEFDAFDHDAPLRAMTAASGIPNDFPGLDEKPFWQNPNAATAESLSSAPSTPLYTPQFNGFATPPPKLSMLEPELYHHDSHSMERTLASMSSYHNSPAISNTSYESLIRTPEIIPSDNQIMAHLSHTRNDSITRPERPQVCVDTSLLFCSQSNYPNSSTLPSAQEMSPGLLSPYSASHETGLSLTSQSPRRHGHTRSAENEHCFGLETQLPNGVDGRGRGLQRVRSAPTSRHHSPYKRPNRLPRTVNNSPSISPGEVGQASGSGTYYPADDAAQASPSPSPSDSAVRHIVATERIRAASTARRLNPVICECEECGQTFTTNFAKDRHMNSHTGERRFACTKPGCNQRFPTDSGRKRHEKSKTLHSY